MLKLSFKLLVVVFLLVSCLSCLKQNEPPVIQDVNIIPSVIYVSDTVQIDCIAGDSDGDALTYTWTSYYGTFINSANSSSVAWNAPVEPGDYEIIVTVSDGKHQVEKTINVVVARTALVDVYVYYTGTRIPVSGVKVSVGEDVFITDESGQFMLKTGIGLHNYIAEKEGFLKKEGSFSFEEGKSGVKIEITSEKYSGIITGTVLNAYDSNPIEGVRVVMLNPDESESELVAMSNSSGLFELKNVPVGIRMINFEHPYYYTFQKEVKLGENGTDVQILLECSAPDIETVSHNLLAVDSLVLEGKISSNCDQNVITGFCYGENSNPTINDETIEVDAESESFSIVLTSNVIDRLKIYYYRAFVQTDAEVVYGDNYSFILGILVDNRENEPRHYITTKVGQQIWMAENLAYLPVVNSPVENSLTDPKYYVYGYNGTDIEKAKQSENFRIYGALYNWPAAINACPEGWHLPTNDDWEELAEYISDQNGGFVHRDDYWINVGLYLKSASRWLANGNGNDEFGFSGLPAGFTGVNGVFYNIEKDGYWWSASELNSSYAWYRHLVFSTTSFFRGNYTKNLGYCVRCLKNK